MKTNETTVMVNGTLIAPKKHYLDYNNDGVSMFEIGSCECEDDEDIASWIPSYLIEDFSNNKPNAKEAIEDYIAGWDSVL